MPPRLSYSIARLREIAAVANAVPWDNRVSASDRQLARVARIAVPELCDALEELDAQVSALTAELGRTRAPRPTLEYPTPPRKP